jgi:hypothetical protein
LLPGAGKRPPSWCPWPSGSGLRTLPSSRSRTFCSSTLAGQNCKFPLAENAAAVTHAVWHDPMYLLDTNVISELRKPRPHGAVVAWLESRDDAELYISAVTSAKSKLASKSGANRMRQRRQKSKRGQIRWPPPGTFCRWMQRDFEHGQNSCIVALML